MAARLAVERVLRPYVLQMFSFRIFYSAYFFRRRALAQTKFLNVIQGAVLWGGQGAHAPVRTLHTFPCAPPMKLIARLQGYTIPVFTAPSARHRIAGVKLHHSLNHALCHPEFLPPNTDLVTPLAIPNCCS